MADFNFITVPELRQSLEGDYRELRACLEAGAWKAVHVLSGSIIEAVLMDALYAEKGFDTSKLDSMELGDIIKISKQRSIISDESEHLSTVIRQYRNLIHPGRVKRLEKAVDKSGGIVAGELVEIVCREVARRKALTYGHTAEQLLKRLTSGSTALPLVTHLLKESKDVEIERLLIDLLPDAYMNTTEDDYDQLEYLSSCYRKVFDAASEGVKSKVTKSLYVIYRTKEEAEVLMYEDAGFLRCSDLKYLDDGERRFIIAHLLPRLRSKAFRWLLRVLEGIGRFVTVEEVEPLTMQLFDAVLGPALVSNMAKSRLYSEYDLMEPEIKSKVHATISAFKEWVLWSRVYGTLQ